MNDPKKELDFKSMKLFIGIDVHKKQWTVTFRTREFELRTFSMDPSPEQLYKSLTRHFPNADYYSVYEAGFCGFWIHRKLCELGIKNIVVNPADIPTKHKEKNQKGDRVDSRKLARELAERTSLDAIYIPNVEQESLRSLSRLLLQITKRTTQSKNRIKHYLHSQGVPVPARSEMPHWSRNFINWLYGVEFKYDTSKYYLEKLIRDLETERSERLKLLRKIREIIKGSKTLLYLKTVPGVGIITAFIFYAEIMDIFRFQKLDHLVSFIGIVPSIDSSDEKVKINGLTNRCNKYLRYLLIEAAWMAIRKDPAMLLAFNELIKTHDRKNAIIRIVKKLINRMRYVWKNQTEYVIAVVQ